MPKENGTKRKGTRVTRPFGHLARCKICREFENSLRSDSSNSLFARFFSAQLRANGNVKMPL